MIKNLLKKIKNKKSRVFGLFTPLFLLIASFGFVFPKITLADELGLKVVRLLTWVFYALFIYIMGKMGTVGMNLLLWISTFSGFTTNSVIIEAWEVVRDLSNLLFIVILLVIAFGTILKIEAYSYKKLLPKMIIMAVLINFSRLICGIIVDAAQIVMLSFVNAFKDAAAAGLYEAFRLSELVALGNNLSLESATATATSIEGGTVKWDEYQYLLTVAAVGFMMLFMTILIFIFVVTLLARIVFIWTLTILSPIAFVCSVLPITQKYSQRWWSLFGRYVAIGPILAFFLWLTLFIVVKAQGGGVVSNVTVFDETTHKSMTQLGVVAKALEPASITNFLIAILMLNAGLQFSQEMSSEIGSLTGKAGNIPKSFARWYGRSSWKLGAGATGLVAGGINDRIYQKFGLDLNVARQYEFLKHRKEELTHDRVLEGRAVAFQAAKRGSLVRSWLGAADYAYENYTPIIGKQQTWKTGFIGGHLQRKFLYTPEYDDLMAQDKSLADQQTDVTQRRDADLARVSEENLTREDLEHRQREQMDRLTQAGGAINAARSRRVNNADTSQRSILQEQLAQLKNEHGNEKTSADRKEELSRMIAELENVLGKSGEVSISGELSVELQDRLGAINREASQKHQEATRRIAEERYSSQKQKTDALHEARKGWSAQLLSLSEDRKHIAHRMHKVMPVTDVEESNIQRQLLSKKVKDIDTENEEELHNLFIDAIMHGKGAEALAVMKQAANVGHLNEMMARTGYDASREGWKKMMEDLFIRGGKGISEDAIRNGGPKDLQNLGLDEQLVLSVCNDASASAKRINHWAFAEAIGVQHGKYDWYPQHTWQERVYTEAAKKGSWNVLQQGNRLAIGEHYYDDQGTLRWRMMPAMMALMAKSFDQRLIEAMEGGTFKFNDNSVDNIYNNPEMLRLLRKMFSSNEQGSRALEMALNRHGDTHLLGRLDDLIGTMGKLLEETQKRAAA